MIAKRLAGRTLACLFIVALMSAASAKPSLAAGGPYQAGLIVVHGDGQVTMRCVAFSETTISGIDLLQQSGLDLNVDASNMVGSAICRLDNEGCTFPTESCFCQCQGAVCTYWSYWSRGPDGAWQYSNLGAGARFLQHGDVDAWLWGPVTSASVNSLPALGFDQICTPPTPTSPPTATATLPPPTETAPPSATNPPPTVPSVTATRPSLAVTPTGSPSATGIPLAFTATSLAPVAPTSTLQPGTPVITAPTKTPALTAEAQSAATTAALPASTEAPTGQTPAAIAMIRPTSGSTRAAVTQSVPSATPRPVSAGSKPTPLLLTFQSPTPVPPSQPSAVSTPSHLLPVLGIILAGFGVCAAVLLRLKRPQ